MTPTTPTTLSNQATACNCTVPPVTSNQPEKLIFNQLNREIGGGEGGERGGNDSINAATPGGRLLVLRLCATVVEGWRPEFDANFNYANEGRGLSRSQVGGARAAA